MAPFVSLMVTLGCVIAFFLLVPVFTHDGYYVPRSAAGHDYWYLIAVAFIPYAWTISAYRRGDRPTAKVLLTAVVCLYVAAIPTPALQSQDAYQSLLYGKMALHGTNPYVVPASSLDDPWRAWTLWDETLSVYGPVWTLLSAAVVKASGEGLTAAFLLLKAVTALLAVGATLALAAAVGRHPRSPPDPAVLRADPGLAILVFGLNPMVLTSVAIGAHADIAAAALIATAVLAETRGGWSLTTVMLASASLVKPYVALVLVAWLICLVRRRDLRTALLHATIAGFVAVMAYLPFWRGLDTFDGLGQVGRAASTSLTGTIIRLASGHPSDAFAAGATAVATTTRAAVLLLMMLAMVYVARRSRTRDEPWRAAAVLLGAYVLLTPWYLYWHLIPLVALASLVDDKVVVRGTLTFSGTSLFVGSGGMAIGLAFQATVRYAPAIVASTWRPVGMRPGRERRREAGPMSVSDIRASSL